MEVDLSHCIVAPTSHSRVFLQRCASTMLTADGISLGRALWSLGRYLPTDSAVFLLQMIRVDVIKLQVFQTCSDDPKKNMKHKLALIFFVVLLERCCSEGEVDRLTLRLLRSKALTVTAYSQGFRLRHEGLLQASGLCQYNRYFCPF